MQYASENKDSQIANNIISIIEKCQRNTWYQIRIIESSSYHHSKNDANVGIERKSRNNDANMLNAKVVPDRAERCYSIPSVIIASIPCLHRLHFFR